MLLAFTFFFLSSDVFKFYLKKKKKIAEFNLFGDTFYYFIFCVLKSKLEPAGPLAAFLISCYMDKQTPVKHRAKLEDHVEVC